MKPRMPQQTLQRHKTLGPLEMFVEICHPCKIVTIVCIKKNTNPEHVVVLNPQHTFLICVTCVCVGAHAPYWATHEREKLKANVGKIDSYQTKYPPGN